MKTVKELEDFIRLNKVYLLTPGMAEWQGKGCYTAYLNFTKPNGCVMSEDENPVTALVKLHKELTPPRKRRRNA